MIWIESPDKETAKNKKSNVSAQDEEEEGKESDDFDVNLDTTIDAVPLLEEKKPHVENNKNGDDFNHGQDQYYMLQKDPCQVYECAKQHSNPSKINIVLRLQPQYARIESMFPVFGLDRQLVQDHPALRHSYRNLVRNLQRKHKEAQLAGRKRLSPIEVMKHLNAGLNELINHTAEMTDDKKAVTTIIAQVSIQCKEIFCVRDVESGEIFQGDDDGQPRDVTHLVRFEICIKELEDGEFDIGRWQITDWDDLLHGNVWFT